MHVHLKMFEVQEPCQPPYSTTSMSCLRLGQLPDVVLGKIISYLHWKEKEWLVLAVPHLERVMNSPLAWETFENDRCYAVEKLYMYIYFPFLVDNELDVIRRYGQFFQSSTLWIHKVLSLGHDKDNDFILLRAVMQHCKQLKSLSIMHPSDISLSKLKPVFQHYLNPLKVIAASRGPNFRISVNRLFYSCIENIETGIISYLTYLDEEDLLGHLACLDFSHGSSYNSQAPAQLLKCINLVTLKCPIQYANTSVIMQLCHRKLTNLYLVNDDYTQQIAFVEAIQWQHIFLHFSSHKRKALNVHYIFKNRSLSNDDFIANPFAKSLILDNLSSNISASMLHHIANVYGLSLINLAFCSNYWEFLMHFADLDQINESFKYVGRKCIELRSFVSCLTLPSSALINLARHSIHMSTVKVYKENIRLTTADKPEGMFAHKMALALDTPRWDMLKKGENIFNIPNVNCRLLFANCFSEH